MSCFHVVIPARLNSTRFPEKLLAPLGGVSILERVYRQALSAKPQSIVIAVDHERIATHARSFGAEVIFTKNTHPSGTDRLAELVSRGYFAPEDVIVNVQGDEPFIPQSLITQVAEILCKSQAPVATLCTPIRSLNEFKNPNVVKVLRTKDHLALYFSRSPIPFHRDQPESFAHAYKHVGLYAYRAAFLLDFVAWPSCTLERDEALEQLRILYNATSILVEEACTLPMQDINTPEDLIEAARYLL